MRRGGILWNGGTSLIEGLLAVVLGCMVLGVLMALSSSTNKMAAASDISAAMQEGAIALHTIQRDVMQAVPRPDPDKPDAVQTNPNDFQLLRGAFKPDGAVDGQLVVYRKQSTPGRNFRLTRRVASGKEQLVPGLFRSVTFAQLDGAGGPFVRITLRLAAHDAPPKPGPPKASEEAVLSALVRIMGPELGGSPQFSWKFLDLLKLIPFLKF